VRHFKALPCTGEVLEFRSPLMEQVGILPPVVGLGMPEKVSIMVYDDEKVLSEKPVLSFRYLLQG
jgi:hypothetical protein